MTVVVLGAGGKLGQLIRPLWPTSAQWTTRQELDVLDSARLQSALQGADAVLCLAGVTHGSPRPMSDNVTLARATLDAARAADAGRVILCSSAAVYGAQDHLLTEETTPAPRAEYGLAKWNMERMANNHPHPSTCLRIGNIAGVDAILGGWRSGFALDQLPDGTTPRRSYIGPRCLARVLSTLMTTPDLPPVLNIAAPGAVQMGDLLDAADLTWTARPATDQTIPRVHLDTSVLEGLFNFDSADSTAAGIVADWRAAKAAS